jgi:hypothetical protein
VTGAADRSRVLAAAVLAAVAIAVLAGCDREAAEPAGDLSAPGKGASVSEPTPVEEADAVITCAQIEPLAAPITGSFSFSPDDSTEDASGTSCVWTNAAVDAASTDLEDYATFGITLDGTGWSHDELATLPGATDDARAEALGGRVLLGTDAETLADAGSVQVLFPEGTVTVVATGALLSASTDTAIPVDAVIDVAAAVARLRQ